MDRIYAILILVCLSSLIFVVVNGLAADAPATTDLIVWNGDDKPGGQGWVSPQKDCSIGAKPGCGRNGTVGLSFVGKGSNWIGFGWNIFGWAPDSGVDTTQYQSLVFWVKVEGGVDPEGLTINLASSGGTGEKKAGQVDINTYCQDYSDGQWHEVIIPLADFMAKNKGIDPKTVWDIVVGSWSANERSFTVVFDEFGLRK